MPRYQIQQRNATTFEGQKPPPSPDQEAKWELIRGEILEVLRFRQAHGLADTPISQSELGKWIDPALETSTGNVGVSVAILEQQGTIIIERRVSPRGARLPSRYEVVDRG